MELLRRPLSLMVAGILLVAVAAGCASDPDDAAAGDAGDGGSGGPDTTAPADPVVERPDELEDLTGQDMVTVAVRDNTFEPRNILVDPGTEIVFEMVGDNAHNVLPAVEGAFPEIDDPTLRAGDASLVVEGPDDLPYYCSLHGTATVGMTGYIAVG